MASSDAKPGAAAPAPPVTPTHWDPDFIEAMYARWKADPASVSESWRMFFTGFELAMCPRDCVAAERASKQAALGRLIQAYRRAGHRGALVNPLAEKAVHVPDLDPVSYGFTSGELDQVFDASDLAGEMRATFGEILGLLRATYCGPIGVEYMHVGSVEAREWLQGRMEPVRNRPSLGREERLDILGRLNDSEIFETFLQSHYPGQKRFSLEGAETLIPALHAFVELAPDLGVTMIVLGMSHRGRLNVLANILDKSYAGIFGEFEDIVMPDSPYGSGDVKYHKGYTSDHRSRSGRMVNLSLSSNPSHLEAVDPVAEGRARAFQRRLDDTETRGKVVPLLIHGEAGFAGQGIVAETLNMSQLKGYSTGGTVHFVINNQIGFTTLPEDQRSSLYATDVAKMVEAPIFHVNGDDPEAVVFVTELALRFRLEFRRDVVIDMMCYRRHGHNEGDDPSITQPLMYAKIRNRVSVRESYTRKLVAEGLLTEEEVERLSVERKTRLQREWEAVRTGQSAPPSPEPGMLAKIWEPWSRPFSFEPVATRAGRPALAQVGRALVTAPDGFRLHPKVARQLTERLKNVEGKGGIEWGLAEALAFGTLLLEGVPIRLSGQDSKRGTFSQRHAEWYDAVTEEPYMPLNHIGEGQAHFCAYNSLLSEAAVLGFDYGYSLVEPEMLILWEAQFGDFSNGAQVIIDNFITSSAAKWRRTSGLVMLLPHGYEGQGPEHSNAYLDRYLAACAGDNIQVCNLTTPAQYFHALRRQVKRPFRRPLIVFSPKSLLRHPRAVSSVDDLIEGGFQEIIDDAAAAAGARRLVFSAGKVYYDLLEARERESAEAPGEEGAGGGARDTALIRIEQLYPFAAEKLAEIARRYREVEKVLWAQEEPMNRGAWTFMQPRLQEAFPGVPTRYAGRSASASPATGSHRIHKEEQARLVREALRG